MQSSRKIKNVIIVVMHLKLIAWHCLFDTPKMVDGFGMSTKVFSAPFNIEIKYRQRNQCGQ